MENSGTEMAASGTEMAVNGQLETSGTEMAVNGQLETSGTEMAVNVPIMHKPCQGEKRDSYPASLKILS